MAALGKTPAPLREKPAASSNLSSRPPKLPRDASPVPIVDTLRAGPGDPPKARASFSRGRSERGTYVAARRWSSWRAHRLSLLLRHSLEDWPPRAESGTQVQSARRNRLVGDRIRADRIVPAHWWGGLPKRG